jgi:hypothetical protein
VATSKKHPPPVTARERPRDVAQGRKVPHDPPAALPGRLDGGGHKGVTGVQMARMPPVSAPITQSGSSASRLGGGGNVGRAARMNHGDIQQGGTVGQGRGHFNVSPRPLTADSCNSKGSLSELRTCSTARTGGDAVESFHWSRRREWLLLRRLQLMAIARYRCPGCDAHKGKWWWEHVGWCQ